MPKLKEHLQEEWDKMSTREKAKLERKRKREEESDRPKSPKSPLTEGNDAGPASKKLEQEVEVPS